MELEIKLKEEGKISRLTNKTFNFDPRLKDGFFAANYFLKSRKIVENYARNHIVTMQFFQRRDDSKLCGVDEAIALVHEYAIHPEELEIVALNDGDADTTKKVEGFEVSGLLYTASSRTGEFPTTEKFDGNSLIRTSIEILVGGMVLPMLGSVTGMIPTDMLSLGGFAGYGMLGLVVLAALPWLLFALVTLIRTLRPKKCWTKVWIVFFFAFLELILGAVLTIGLKVAFPMLKPTLLGLIANGDSTFTSLLGGLNLSIQFGCYWASLVYIAMIPLTIIYMIIAHGPKKEFKEFKKQKKAEKLAKKAA